jgi:nitrate reductase gamma subunit
MAEPDKIKGLTPIGIAGSACLAVTGGFGGLDRFWGYGLLLVAAMLLIVGTVSFCIYIFTNQGSSKYLVAAMKWPSLLGAWLYVLGVAALAGYYVFEAQQGRVETKWMVFGPAILLALIAFDYGIYQVLVKRNLPTINRFGKFMSREKSDPAAMRKTLIDDVVLHRTLLSVSGFRWFKHTLIFWGFGLLFITESFAVMFREVLPAFGVPEYWEEAHPLRLAFDFSFDFFGLMSLVGCALALVWRVKVNGTDEQKYSDTPTALFLFLVLLSGFMVEAVRIAAIGVSTHDAASFVGYAVSGIITNPNALYAALYDPLWLFHVIGSCLFIAYVPAKRLVHSCATPIGRLMHSQKSLLELKKTNVLQGLMGVRPDG